MKCKWMELYIEKCKTGVWMLKFNTNFGIEFDDELQVTLLEI